MKALVSGRLAREGLATLVATAEHGVTHLTTVSHRSPARLLPMRSPLAEAAGAGLCLSGSYGGGLLGGDEVKLDVCVMPGAFRTDLPPHGLSTASMSHGARPMSVPLVQVRL